MGGAPNRRRPRSRARRRDHRGRRGDRHADRGEPGGGRLPRPSGGPDVPRERYSRTSRSRRSDEPRPDPEDARERPAPRGGRRRGGDDASTRTTRRGGGGRKRKIRETGGAAY